MTKEVNMKKLLALVACLGVVLFLSGCSYSTQPEKKEVSVQPNNIDSNNVGITKQEGADQTDPTLIEGNLEDNDFKN